MFNLNNLAKSIGDGLNGKSGNAGVVNAPGQVKQSEGISQAAEGKGQGKEATKMVSGDKAKSGGLGNDIANVAGSLLHNVMTAPPIASDGMDYMGDFDLDSFIGGNLNKARTSGGDGLTKLIGGIMKAVGLGG